MYHICPLFFDACVNECESLNDVTYLSPFKLANVIFDCVLDLCTHVYIYHVHKNKFSFPRDRHLVKNVQYPSTGGVGVEVCSILKTKHAYL
jgi:hypothetical protein